MRRTLTFAVILVALYVAQTAPVRTDNCVADPVGGLACGEGKGALRVFADSTLPSKGYAFVWRIEAANSRWDTDSLVYYLLEGATATTLDLRALVEPAMKAKLPPKKRESNSFRVREDLPVKLDASGHARLAQCFMCRREKRASTYKVQIDIVRETRQAGGADCVDAAGQSGLSQASR